MKDNMKASALKFIVKAIVKKNSAFTRQRRTCYRKNVT